MIYDKDADLGKLDGKTVAVLGYGSQGHAHALNLKDSGVDVVVGLRDGSDSAAKAEADGLRVESLADAASLGDVVMVLLPDEKQAKLWEAEIRDGIAPGNLLLFAHGFSIHFGQIDPRPGGGRGHDRPQGPGPPRAPPVRGGQRRARPGGRAPRLERPGPRPGARLRARDRLHARGRDRDHLQGRDRDRPVRRAGRALRRRERAGAGRATRRSWTPGTTRGSPTSSASTSSS